jgi:hypothetical protein
MPACSRVMRLKVVPALLARGEGAGGGQYAAHTPTAFVARPHPCACPSASRTALLAATSTALRAGHSRESHGEAVQKPCRRSTAQVVIGWILDAVQTGIGEAVVCLLMK